MSLPLTLDSEVRYLKGVGPARAPVLAERGIRTVRDLLFLFPRRYHDFTRITPIASLREGESFAVRGRITRNAKGNRFTRVKHRMTVSDGTGTVEAIWFKTLNGLDDFAVGEEVFLCGRVSYRAGFTMAHPTIERASGELRRAGKITPVYPDMEGIGEGLLARLVRTALSALSELPPEVLPAEVTAKRGFPPRWEALKAVHAPEDPARLKAARERFIYEEFFAIQVNAALNRHYLRSAPKPCRKKMTPLIDSRIRARFPFRFTGAQERVIREITADMTAPEPMNRLLQGDVGSGKTAVALYAALLTVANRQQAAFLVPTDVLAQQHFETVRRFLEGSRVRVELLTGSLPAAERERVKELAAAGEADIVVGTHSLLTEGVEFARLGLAVVDEQHRFGVAQRAALKRKGVMPDTLVMTATPIPRTLAMTLFGDLDVSVIDELPPGRKPVRTLRFPPEEEYRAHALVRKELEAGGRAFVVCPFIEEGKDNGERAAAEAVYERLSREVYPDRRVGLLHGRMPPSRREEVMESFRRGEIEVLVSTVIIEVGVDVPEASVMLILGAERFGLATLHQLRGRVGRGERLSWCLCVGDLKTEDARKRLDIFCATTDGFRIAEEDLKLRGPGEVLGTKQHGTPPLRWGSLTEDFETLKAAREDAFALIEKGWRPGEEWRREMKRLYGGWGESLATVG